MTKYCTQCGAELMDGARFCKKCGAQVTPTQPTVEQQAGQQGWNRASDYASPSYEGPAGAQTPGYGQYPYQAPYAVRQTGLKANVAALLCYPLLFSHPLLVIVGVLFLVLPPYNRDRFVKFHAYQSIFFGAALFLARIALGIFSIVTPAALDRLLYGGLKLATVVGLLYAMYKAYHGDAAQLPVVGEAAERQASK